MAFRQRQDFSFDWVDTRLEQLAGVAVEAWGRRPADFWELVHEEDRVWLRGHLAGAAEAPGWLSARYRLRHGLTGQVCHVLECRRLAEEQAGRPGVFEGLWLDQTRLTRAERRLTAVAGRETLVQLAAGYVHDLNNVFSGISSVAQLSLVGAKPDQPLGENLEMMKANIERARHLLEDLSGLMHPSRGRPGYYDLNELGESSLRLLRPGVVRRIALEGRWAAGSLPVFLDGNAFRQVIFHLVLNAAAAITGPGRIVLETWRQEAVTPELAMGGTVPRGPVGCLAVTDTGRGIVPGDGSRVFDWCYSTRVGGGGMGLGLAYVREFILAQGGAVTAESAPGGGTAMRLWLPLTDFGEDETGGAGGEGESRRVLLAGPASPVGEELAAGLRAQGWEVVWAKRDAELSLAAGDESYAAAVVFLGLGTDGVEGFVERVRQQKVPLRIAWVREAPGVGLSQAVLEQLDFIVDWGDGAEGPGERLGVWLRESAGVDPKLPAGAG